MERRLPGTEGLGPRAATKATAFAGAAGPRQAAAAGGRRRSGTGAEAEKTHPAQRRGRLETGRLLQARKEGDPQLVTAIGYLGSHFVGKSSAAELLVRLLEGPPTSTDSDEGPRQSRTSTNLIEAIVAALTVNGTPLAWQTIDQLASGNLKTSDNRTAAAAALKILLSRSGPENEESLLRVVALAGQPQPADRNPAELKGQHGTLLDLLKSSASSSLRLRAGQLHDRARDATSLV